MKTNRWPLEIEEKGHKKEENIFPSLSQSADESGGDWLLLIKSLPAAKDGVWLEHFFTALCAAELLPSAIIFMGGAVSLACCDSAVLDKLFLLEQRRVEIFSSLACLENFDLRRQICVGKIIGMAAIVSRISHTLRVVTL
jgi:hypothetical protein